MRERVRYLGGTLEIGRSARGGTRVAASLPARSAQEAAA
jgi:signal transduction histidine kinase